MKRLAVLQDGHSLGLESAYECPRRVEYVQEGRDGWKVGDIRWIENRLGLALGAHEGSLREQQAQTEQSDQDFTHGSVKRLAFLLPVLAW